MKLADNGSISNMSGTVSDFTSRQLQQPVYKDPSSPISAETTYTPIISFKPIS